MFNSDASWDVVNDIRTAISKFHVINLTKNDSGIFIFVPNVDKHNSYCMVNVRRVSQVIVATIIKQITRKVSMIFLVLYTFKSNFIAVIELPHPSPALLRHVM